MTRCHSWRTLDKVTTNRYGVIVPAIATRETFNMYHRPFLVFLFFSFSDWHQGNFYMHHCPLLVIVFFNSVSNITCQRCRWCPQSPLKSSVFLISPITTSRGTFSYATSFISSFCVPQFCVWHHLLEMKMMSPLISSVFSTSDRHQVNF